MGQLRCIVLRAGLAAAAAGLLAAGPAPNRQAQTQAQLQALQAQIAAIRDKVSQDAVESDRGAQALQAAEVSVAAGRARLADLRHDGYGHVVAEPGFAASPYNSIGQDVSNKDVFSGRANLTIKWGESSKLKIIAEDTLDNSNASGGQRLNNYLAPQLSDPFDTRTDMPVDKDYTHRSGESATYTQSLSDQLALKIVGAYLQGRSQQFIDFEELDANLFQVPGAYHDQQSSGEGQLTFKNDLVNAVGGVFYMDSTACGSYNASIGTLNLLGLPAFDLYITELVKGCVLTKSSAVYGDTALYAGGQNPVLERCSIPQRPRLAGQNRHVVPGIIHSPLAPEAAAVIADNMISGASRGATLGMNLDRPVTTDLARGGPTPTQLTVSGNQVR